MRRIVGSCLGAHQRLPVMPVQPRRQSVCFRRAWFVCSILTGSKHYNAYSYPDTLRCTLRSAQSILDVRVQAVGL